MKNSEIIVVFLGSALGIFLYGLILKKIRGSLPFVDALTTVLSIVAQILCVKDIWSNG